jgi:hypothetical protein
MGCTQEGIRNLLHGMCLLAASHPNSHNIPRISSGLDLSKRQDALDIQYPVDGTPLGRSDLDQDTSAHLGNIRV